jgi:hypothetical protein
VRPYARARTSALVNAGEVSVELFPVSFVGLQAGTQLSNRNTKLDTLDCTMVACQGNLSTTYLRAKGVVGYAGFFLGGSAQVGWQRPSDTTLPFGDDASSLAGLAGGDTLVSFEGYAGYRPPGPYSFGVYASRDRFTGSGAANDMESVMARRSWGPWRVMLGLGAYESTTRDRGFTTYGVVEWIGVPSLGL